MDSDGDMGSQTGNSTTKSSGLTPEMRNLMKDCGDVCKPKMEYESFCRTLLTVLVSIGLQDKLQYIFSETAAKMDSAELLNTFMLSCKYYFMLFKLFHTITVAYNMKNINVGRHFEISQDSYLSFFLQYLYNLYTNLKDFPTQIRGF